MTDKSNLELLNDHVKSIKERERARLNTIKENTSNMYIMFESNKDYFKHCIDNYRISNQYIEMMNLLMKYSGLARGQFNEDVIKQLLFSNGIFTVKAYSIAISVIYLIVQIVATIIYIKLNLDKTYAIFTIFTLLLVSVFYTIYAFLLRSSIRFFKIKDPSNWD